MYKRRVENIKSTMLFVN